MTDIDERFRALDRIEFPHTALNLDALPRREPPRVRADIRAGVGVIVLAFALTAATVGFMVTAFRGGGGRERVGTSPTEPAPVAINGRLAFNCDSHVCTINPDGTDQIDLFAAYDSAVVVVGYAPRWSPDGTKLAFYGYNHRGASSGGGANYDIFTMNADGSKLQNLTTSQEDEAAGASQGQPIWSPDGSMIAFEGDDGRTDGLYVMDSDGSDLSRVADGGGTPAWSPDGSRILFAGKGTDGADLFAIAPDGTQLLQITSGPGSDYDPSWSPDGSRIAFVRSDRQNGGIFVARADGSSETAVFDASDGPYSLPQWSPDGTRLLLDTGPYGKHSVFAVQTDGSGATDLTASTERDENTPVWSPDGSQIAFEGSKVTGGVENLFTFRVYVMNADGSGERVLTADDTRGFSVEWQPLTGGETSTP